MQQVLASSLPSSPSHPITPCENTGRSFNLHTDNAAWCMCSIIADMQILPTMRGSAPAWVNTFFSRAQLCQHRRGTLSCAGFSSIYVDEPWLEIIKILIWIMKHPGTCAGQSNIIAQFLPFSQCRRCAVSAGGAEHIS